MSEISESISFQTVQLMFSEPSSNLINPEYLLLGRNYDYTSINRAYIRFSLSQINPGFIINSVILKIPVALSTPEENNLLVFLAQSNISSLNNVVWNNINQIQIGTLISSTSLYSNNFISIDITEYVKSAILSGSVYFELMLVSNEVNYSNIALRNKIINDEGLKIDTSYIVSQSSLVESIFNVNVSSLEYSTSSIEFYNYKETTIFINNKGSNVIKYILENSYDNISFIEEASGIDVNPGSIAIAVPYYFSKYLRVKLISSINKIEALVTIQSTVT